MANETRFSNDPPSHGDGLDFELSGSSTLSLNLPCELGDYRVLELIGSGGMGQVYRAEHIRMARPVALKTLRPELVSNARAVDRFFSEVRAAGRAIHANLVVAFDAGSTDGTHYLAMELVSGETLAQIVTDGGPLGEAEAVRVIRDAALGLHAAHEAGLIHRDVKPSNLMRTADGGIKVLDLGLATISTDLNPKDGQGRLVGTIEYMSPEQLRNPGAIDRCADVYSLGATLFYLLVGRPPYTGSLAEQVRAHRELPPPELYRFRHDADLRLDHIMRRMLAKRPEDRFQNMREVVASLEPLIASLSTQKPHPTSTAFVKDLGTVGQGLSTSSTAVSFLGIDLGLYYAASAMTQPDGQVRPLANSVDQRPLLRCAVAAEGNKLLIGEEAIRLRPDAPARVTHSLQLYLGRSVIDRDLLGHKMPPEAWLGLLLAQIRGKHHTEGRSHKISASAVSVPACYNQAYRRAILRAATIAGLPSPRLVDRPLAACCSQLNPEVAAMPPPDSSMLCHWLVVTIAGNAMEVSILRHIGGHFQMIASCGSTSAAIPAWHQRLADMVANDCKRRSGIDPRAELHSAVSLQIACEKALRELAMRDSTDLSLKLGNRHFSLQLTREALKATCHDLFSQLEAMIAEAIVVADIRSGDIQQCLSVGSLARLPIVTQTIRRHVRSEIEVLPIDQASIACGVAMVAGANMLGSGNSLSSRSCTTHDYGILVHSNAEGRRPATVISRNASLPFNKVRRLKRTASSSKNEIAVVESTSWQGQAWQSLGVHRSDLLLGSELVELNFAMDDSGLLELRLNDPVTGRSETIGPLPQSPLASGDMKNWRKTIESLLQATV